MGNIATSRGRLVMRLAVGVAVAAATVSSAQAEVGFGSAPSTRASLARPAFGDGIYRVGKEIQPGIYRARAAPRPCSWRRLSSIAFLNSRWVGLYDGTTPAIVTILRSDRGFRTRGCGNWTRNLSRVTANKTRFGQGTFIVGTDIAPGRYRNSRGAQICRWARLGNFTFGDHAFITSGRFGRTVVRISRGDQGFYSFGCGTWRRVPNNQWENPRLAELGAT